MKSIHKEKLTGTTSSGTFSTNSSSYIHGILRNVAVKPTTSTTTYNVAIVDDLSMTIWNRESETGSFSEQLELPVKGVLTFTVSSATADEAFTIELGIDE